MSLLRKEKFAELDVNEQMEATQSLDLDLISDDSNQLDITVSPVSDDDFEDMYHGNYY